MVTQQLCLRPDTGMQGGKKLALDAAYLAISQSHLYGETQAARPLR